MNPIVPPSAQDQIANIKVCQPGYDVRTCPDWAFLFNGAWPSLTIAFETTVVSDGSGAPIPHNLGFPPLAFAWETQNGLNYGRTPHLEVSSQDVFLFDAGTYTVRCYNIDISKEASYPLPQAANAKLPYNNQFGIKEAKDGRGIASNNLNDFILHSRAQSPALVTVATEKGGYFLQSNARHYWPYGAIQTWDLIVYPITTPFIPWNFGCVTFGDDFYSFAPAGAIWYDSTTKSLVLNISASGAGSMIILRDPLFYPNTVQVTY